MKIISRNNLSEIDNNLIKYALDIRQKSYSPYSNYKVGAALIDNNNVIHTGCNIESADYTLTSHAEMVAIDSMVKSGCLNVKKIVIVTKGLSDKPATPCGLCRQKISEFNKSNDCIIWVVNIDSDDIITNIYEFILEELLPFSFNNDFLEK